MVDVMIIGGGPAGVTAGTILQKKGYRTCIIDCQVFPREKLCAGVLTAKTIKFIHDVYEGLELENMDISHIRKIELLYNHKVIGKYQVQNAYSAVNRTEFDDGLLQYYINMGGIVLEGQKEYKIVYDKSMIRLSNGRKIKYRFLVGADGINSKVRTFIQHNWRASVFCFEGFIPNESKEDTIKINFGGLLGGYSWRIPSEKRIGIGLGELYVRGLKRMPQKYKKYFNAQGIENDKEIKGAFVSMGHYVKKPIKSNVLLVGDAAGLIDAMTGEGIYFALESGRQAALAIRDHIEKEKPLMMYQRRLKKIHRKMREQSIYNKLLYAPLIQLISLSYVRRNPEFVQRVLENVISTYQTGYTTELIYNKKLKFPT